ncbi:SAGA-associated factor 11 homolog isoform X1 [Diorhabda sublineata]|uniref:SAGA-associated factor 11 homolog isoform X1 n=1 Tax=Diorhabda sublineata TaxID=1163346 RepID=UPI0024E0FC42|nr:SAGA-associated factor 11 homolog isoform X1 [Diorhabda sublineata]
MSERKNKLDQKQLFNHLAKDFHELVSNKQALRSAVDTFFNNVIDDLTVGIIFDLHRKYKTNAYALDIEDTSEDTDQGDFDIFSHNSKKNQDCICPNCDRAVAAITFARHLETCMGMGRLSRNASRRALCNNKDNSAYGGLVSDDDDDVDWGTAEQRKKKRDKNGSKNKRVGTPKKNYEHIESVDSLNVDIEGEDEELTNLRDILRLQDYSNSTSPADSASSSGSTKKRDKSKSKKSSKRERRSPSPNSVLD